MIPKFSAMLRTRYVALIFALLIVQAIPSTAQSRKVIFAPHLDLGFASGYNAKNSPKLDIGNSGGATLLGFNLGYYLNNNISVYTGLGFGMYDYDLRYGTNANPNLDTVRKQSENLLEVPLGIRYTSFPKKQFKTRHYVGAGFRFAFLNDARAKTFTKDGSYYIEGTKASDFNPMYLRFFVEAGLDIPLDYNSAFLVGVSLSNGITRNMSKTGALANANYGMFVANLSVGFRFGMF